jgi:hypothetical protein
MMEGYTTFVNTAIIPTRNYLHMARGGDEPGRSSPPTASAGRNVGIRVFQRPNDTLAKLQAAPHTSGDAARPLPRLTIALAEAICNGRDAVANEAAEALQRRAKESAVCQLQLIVRRRAMSISLTAGR